MSDVFFYHSTCILYEENMKDAVHYIHLLVAVKDNSTVFHRKFAKKSQQFCRSCGKRIVNLITSPKVPLNIAKSSPQHRHKYKQLSLL